MARVARAWSLSERRYVSISWPPPGGEAPRAAVLLSATRSDERRRTRAGRRRFGDARHASGAGRAWGCSCAERRGGDCAVGGDRVGGGRSSTAAGDLLVRVRVRVGVRVRVRVRVWSVATEAVMRA